MTAPRYKLLDGRELPALALGTALGTNSEALEESSSSEVEAAVCWALDAGYRHVDTAAVYKTEEQIGRALARKIGEGLDREELFITTKLWIDSHARDAVVPALRQSLRRLALGYVDLYLIHWPVGQFKDGTYDYTDYVETWRGMLEAKRLGLARSVGVSNFNQQQIERLLRAGLESPAVLQVEINLNLQQPSLLSYCREKGIVVMGYTPLGSLLPDKADPSAPPPRLHDSALAAIANKHHKSVTQIVLRYLVELGVIPLPKSVTKSRIEQNLAVFDFSLSAVEKELLRSFDCGYRTIPQLVWRDHPHYPFEKSTEQ